jgi:hypothetical protein
MHTSNQIHPSTLYLSAIKNKVHDMNNCLTHLQTHVCSNYCLRHKLSSKCSKQDTTPKKRVCRSGAGEEQTEGKGDTPGFPLKDQPEIVMDARGFLRLDLQRNNRRIIQTSTYALEGKWINFPNQKFYPEFTNNREGWRANCDVQILLYQTLPTKPNPSEIAKVTDYIVSYACKGSESFIDEKQRLKSYLLELKADQTKDAKTEATWLSRKVLNKTMTQKVISKQECMVLLSSLDLYKCSEHIDTISISGSYKLTSNSYNSKQKNLMKLYQDRICDHHLTLDEFYFLTKKNTIPHYVGGNSTPIFPPTKAYARSVLLLHKPWINQFDETQDFIQASNDFIQSGICPKKVLIPFERVKQWFYQKLQHHEHISQIETIDFNSFTKDISDSVRDVVDIATTMQIDETEIESSEDMPFDYGALYDWSKPIIANHQKRIEGKTWVENTVCHDDNENTSEDLNLPKKSNGEYYSLDTLSLDQKQVLAFCLQQIKNQIDNLEDDIETMCLTVRGMAGSGKSTFIKTLVTTIRNFFQ